MATSPQPQKQQPYRETAAVQIRHLSTLSQRIPGILTTSATSFSQLTNAPIPTADGSGAGPDTPASRRAALSTSANEFYTSVLELRTALHAQIDDLEKHGVIPADELKFKAVVQQPGGGTAGAGAGGGTDSTDANTKEKKGDAQASVTNNGLGNFDVGVLNARAGVRQKDGEEVLARMKRVVDGLVERVGAEEGSNGDQEMKDG